MSLILGVYFESCFFYVLAFLFVRFFLSSVLSVTLKRMWLESLWVLFFSSRFFIVFVPASCCLFRDTLVVKKKPIFLSFCFPPFFLLRDCVHGVVIFHASFFIVLLSANKPCSLGSFSSIQVFYLIVSNGFSTDSTNMASTGLWLLSVVEGRLHLCIFSCFVFLLLIPSEASKTCCAVFCISKHLQL